MCQAGVLKARVMSQNVFDNKKENKSGAKDNFSTFSELFPIGNQMWTQSRKVLYDQMSIENTVQSKTPEIYLRNKRYKGSPFDNERIFIGISTECVSTIIVALYGYIK